MFTETKGDTAGSGGEARTEHPMALQDSINAVLVVNVTNTEDRADHSGSIDL